MLRPGKNLAEVAFSISKDFQGKGIGKILIRKLSAAARENGIAGFMAYTSHKNEVMIKLFNSLPFKIKTFFDGEMLMLSCRLDERKKRVETSKLKKKKKKERKERKKRKKKKKKMKGEHLKLKTLKPI